MDDLISKRFKYREMKQKYYGYYCQMSRGLKIDIIPYYDFNVEVYNETKRLWFNTKK